MLIDAMWICDRRRMVVSISWLALFVGSCAGCTTDVGWTVEGEVCADDPSATVAPSFYWAITTGECSPAPGAPIDSGELGEPFHGTLDTGTYCFWTLAVRRADELGVCSVVATASETRELPRERDPLALSMSCVDDADRVVWDGVVERVANCSPACDPARCECPLSGDCSADGCSPPLVATAVALGERHACTWTLGSRSISCWGEVRGFLDDPMGETTIGSPMNIPLETLGQEAGIIEVDVGDGLTCVRTFRSEVQCWGELARDFVGTSIRMNMGSGRVTAADMDVGDGFACAVADVPRETSKGVFCWGLADAGRLGTSDGRARSGAVQITLPAVITANPGSVSAGGGHACVIAGGDLVCWGDNELGQAVPTLDDSVPAPRVAAPTIVPRPTLTRGEGPTRVTTTLVWTHVSAGSRRTCATDSGQRLHCWGEGLRAIRCLVGEGCELKNIRDGLGWVSVSTGTTHVCALTTAGKQVCFSPAATSDDEVIDGVIDLVDAVAGDGVTCGRRDDGLSFSCEPFGGTSADELPPPSILGSAHARPGLFLVCP